LNILDCKDEAYKKENARELADIFKGLVRNMRINEPIQIKMQTTVFEKLLKIIDFSISSKNKSVENLEKSLSTFNSEITHYMKNDALKVKFLNIVKIFA